MGLVRVNESARRRIASGREHQSHVGGALKFAEVCVRIGADRSRRILARRPSLMLRSQRRLRPQSWLFNV
jgi:hypothetical protein